MQPHSPPRGPDIEVDRSGKAFLKLSPQTRALLAEARSTSAFIAGADGEEYPTIFDCGSSWSLTDDFKGTSNCQETDITIQLAKKGDHMKATYQCDKTYILETRSGDLVRVTTPALIVPSLKAELIGGRAMTKAGYQVILDESDQVAGIYPKDTEGKVKDISQSIPFIPEYRSLFGVKVIDMTLQEFEKKRGIDLWHQRLGHVSKETILRSKEATTGMEGLKGKGET